MSLSVDDAILRLKAEIIAQDWRLSPKRVEQLAEAFACLREQFKERKAVHSMLVMAVNVLDYIKGRGTSPPDTIDFLKEAMAHIVNLHEDLVVDPVQDEKLFQGLFSRFSTLKAKILKRAGKNPPPADPERPSPGPARPTAESGPDEPDDDLLAADEADPGQLCADFIATLAASGEVGSRLSQLLATWLESPAVVAILAGSPGEESTAAAASPSPIEHITACPPTPVRLLTISGLAVAIQSNVIALIRPVTPAQASAYLHNSSVPLKDFARFLHKLSRQFTGGLSLVKERTLKGLSLPVMIPQGHELPEAPAAECKVVVVISNGNRHGVLTCDDIQDTDQMMIQFAKQQNGDLAGTAYLAEGGRIPLLDTLPLLRREGILLLR